jgi:hypothetical protein
MTVGVEKFEPAKSFDHLLVEHHLDGLSTKVRLQFLPRVPFQSTVGPSFWPPINGTTPEIAAQLPSAIVKAYTTTEGFLLEPASDVWNEGFPHQHGDLGERGMNTRAIGSTYFLRTWHFNCTFLDTPSAPGEYILKYWPK